MAFKGGKGVHSERLPNRPLLMKRCTTDTENEAHPLHHSSQLCVHRRRRMLQSELAPA